MQIKLIVVVVVYILPNLAPPSAQVVSMYQWSAVNLTITFEMPWFIPLATQVPDDNR